MQNGQKLLIPTSNIEIFGMNIMFANQRGEGVELKNEFKECVEAISTFIICHKMNDGILKHFYLGFGGRRYWFYGNIIHAVFSKSSTLKCRFYDPLFKLLNNIPKSLIEIILDLKLNWTQTTDIPQRNCNVYLSESMRIAKYLTNISINNKLKNIERISINGLRLHPNAKNWLNFYFGYNNKIIQKQLNYDISYL